MRDSKDQSRFIKPNARALNTQVCLHESFNYTLNQLKCAFSHSVEIAASRSQQTLQGGNSVSCHVFASFVVFCFESMELLSNCDSLSEQFFNSFNVSKPRENDTLRPHPKYWRLDSRNSHDHVKRIQNDRRKEFLDRIARFVSFFLDKANECVLQKTTRNSAQTETVGKIV